MSNSITFLHAADLHLDSPFKGLTDVPDEIFQSIRKSTFQAFDRLIEVAIEKRVDFVLIVGDLFDHECQSLKAQLHLRDGFERLNQEQIYVYLSYGNHDFLSGNPYPIEFPENVFVFPSEEVSSFTFRKNGQKLANIYGFSYEKRDVNENKAQQFTITDQAIPFHIAMLHGMVHGASDHDPNAPFRLEDLRNEPFDYWALGHIHKREILQSNPPVVYPGNIQGRHRKETGEKGCYFVEMDESDVHLQFIPLQAFTIIHEEINLTNFSNMTDIKDFLIERMEKTSYKPHLYTIDFYSNVKQNEELGINERISELVEIVNETFQSNEAFQYVYSYRLSITDEKERAVDTLFMEEIKEVVNSMDVLDEIKDLYNHRDARSYVSVQSETELLQEAYELLIDELHRKVR